MRRRMHHPEPFSVRRKPKRKERREGGLVRRENEEARERMEEARREEERAVGRVRVWVGDEKEGGRKKGKRERESGDRRTNLPTSS